MHGYLIHLKLYNKLKSAKGNFFNKISLQLILGFDFQEYKQKQVNKKYEKAYQEERLN